jgi:hypothetical protein
MDGAAPRGGGRGLDTGERYSASCLPSSLREPEYHLHSINPRRCRGQGAQGLAHPTREVKGEHRTEPRSSNGMHLSGGPGSGPGVPSLRLSPGSCVLEDWSCCMVCPSRGSYVGCLVPTTLAGNFMSGA